MYVLGKFLHIVGYLQAELACRRHYYSLSAAVGSVDTLYERQSESRSLARTGLCEGNKVRVFRSEEERDGLLLHRHRVFKTEFFDSASYIFVDAKFFKCLQCLLVYWLWVMGCGLLVMGCVG